MKTLAAFSRSRLGCIIRAPLPDDCEKMAELARQLGYQCTPDEIRDRLSQMLDPKQYIIYIAELSGGEMAGWIGGFLFRSVENPPVAEISGLVVDERLRSRGIGKLLLEAAEQWARSIGCQAVSVRSNVKRERAHRFYRNNGYEPIKAQTAFHKCL
jgi:GNAT superfamily N-acetyltransferase